MSSVLRVSFALIAVLLLATACSAPEAFPPLEGRYRAPGGAILAFQPNNVLVGPAGRGSFTVDGTAVSLKLSDGRTLVAERETADILVIETDGTTPDGMRMYREGSAAAQTSEARKPAP